MGDYRKLDLWNRAHQLTLAIYQMTIPFPPYEQYGLTAQMRRAACSIAMNIAEGCGRNSDAELGRFLRIALGSAAEVEYQVVLSQELGYLQPEAARSICEEIDHLKRMLSRLVRRLHQSPPTGRTRQPPRIADSG
jgi:four helix bundle protein